MYWGLKAGSPPYCSGPRHYGSQRVQGHGLITERSLRPFAISVATALGCGAQRLKPESWKCFCHG